MKKGNGIFWKKAAACIFAAAFLLSACGSTAKSSSDSQGAYEESTGYAAPASSSYKAGSANVSEEDSWEETDGMILDETDAPLAAAESYDSGSGVSDEGDPDSTVTTSEGGDKQESSNRKIVYTGNITLQSLEYDKSSSGIHEKISSYGGFIESEDTYNNDPYWYYSSRSGSSARRTQRNLNITARIPAENFDAFMKDLENEGQVTNTSVSAQNISVQYATHDASKKALEIEQARLLEMMDKAETVEDMIAVEQRLTEVERELNDEKTQLSDMDRDVGYSTVYISLEEVFEYSENVVEVTYGERLNRAFHNAIDNFAEFWGDLTVWIVENFPFLIMLVIIIFVIVKLARRSSRRRMERRAQLEAERMRAMQNAAAAGTGPAAGSVNGIYGAGGMASRPPKKGFFSRRKDVMPADAGQGPQTTPETGTPADVAAASPADKEDSQDTGNA